MSAVAALPVRHRQTTREGAALTAILLVALLARLYHVGAPVCGWHAWRQADTAAMARNFTANGFDFLHPQIDWGGAGSGVVESEFPLYSYAVAGLYAAFGPRDPWGRLVSVVCATATVWVLYELVRRRVSRGVALWAALFYAIAPLDVFYGRAFMPEAAMLLASVAGVSAFSRWSEGGSPRYLVLAWLGLTLAALLKLPALYLGIPVAHLAYRRHGWRFLRNGALLGFAAAVVVPVALWYGHAHRLLLEGGESFGIWEVGRDKWGNLDLLARPSFYADVFLKSLAERHLTYAGVAPFAVGLALKRRGPGEALFDWWLAGVVVYILIVARGNQVHEYYQLPFAFPAAVFVGKAFDRFLPPRAPDPPARRAGSLLLALCLLALPILSAVRLAGFYRREDRQGPLFRLAAAVDRTTSPGDRIVVANDGNPILLYRSARKGWCLTPERLDLATLDSLGGAGARVVVGETREFRSPPRQARLREWRNALPAAEESPEYFVFRLAPEGRGSSRAGTQRVIRPIMGPRREP